MFLSSVFLLLFTIGLSSSRICNMTGTSYICTDMTTTEDFIFPLPALVQKVMFIGTNNILKSFPLDVFGDGSWINLSELSLHLFTDINSIGKFLLKGLKNLRFLSISECYRLELIDSDLFESTPDLEALHLDGDVRLSLSIVQTALTGKVSKLKYLSLKEIQTYTRQPTFIGNNFIKALEGKKLLYLDISLANIAGISWNEDYQDALYNLRYFNLSHTKVTSNNVRGLITGTYYPNLEVLDISGCQSYIGVPIVTTIHLERCTMSRNVKYLFYENIYASQKGIYLQLKGTYNDCSDCSSLEVFDISNNGFVYFIFTMTRLKCFQNLVTLNLSRNGLEKISPSSLGIFSALMILDLSENRLYKMEHMADFNNLLEGNYMLEALFIRTNQLSLIPSTLFINNSRLMIIDLRDNEISALSINFSNNLNLKIFYIGNNRLRSLDYITYQTLEAVYLSQANDNISYSYSFRSEFYLESLDKNIIRERYAYNNSLKPISNINMEFKAFLKHLTIDLSNNPIECRCENKGYLKWVIDTSIQFMAADSLVCSYGNTVSLIDRTLYESITFNCFLLDNVTKGISATLSVILSVIIAVFVIRKMRLNCRKAKFIEILKKEIRKRRRNFNYVAFIPYCSYDYGVVEETILPALRASLKKSLNTENEVICTGADNFIPGRYIIDEIHRCMDECLVVVPIITSAFIRSPWSQNECSVAIQKHREVLVLMENQTDIAEAEQTVKCLIEECTRATWSHKEGQLVIHPSLDLFCERIITVAAETLYKHKQYRRQRPENLIPLLAENYL